MTYGVFIKIESSFSRIGVGVEEVATPRLAQLRDGLHVLNASSILINY